MSESLSTWRSIPLSLCWELGNKARLCLGGLMEPLRVLPPSWKLEKKNHNTEYCPISERETLVFLKMDHQPKMYKVDKKP